MNRDDPYHDRKIYHRAHLINSRGGVSPLCAKTPRTINLKRALWTNRDDVVTCPACLRKIAELAAERRED